MSDLMTALPAYAPVLAYLVMVCGLLAATGSCPTWVHPVALLAGIPPRFLTSGWGETGFSVAVAAFFFVFLVYFAGRSVSGATLFTLVTTIALTPIDAWVGIALGLGAVAVVAVRRVLVGHGKDRVSWIVLDTMGGVGLRPGRGIGLPDASTVPTKDAFAPAPAAATVAVGTAVPAEATLEPSTSQDQDREDALTSETPSTDSQGIYLPPYLLAGVTVAMLAGIYVG